MNRSIDLNADLGEGGDHDASIMPLVSSANIACGAHAGDEQTMRHTILAALQADVAIGAHPGYEDREHFGRRPLALEPSTLSDSLLKQLDLFRRIARSCGADPHHVKPHGALYHQVDSDPNLASLFIDCVQKILPSCRIYGPPCGALATAANAAGLPMVVEGFADRLYQDDGHLVPRHQPEAVISDPKEAATQALEIATHGQVITRSGTTLTLPAQTLCIHGDGPHVLALLSAIRQTLSDEKIPIRKP